MWPTRGSPKDRFLFRVLRKHGPTAASLCEKLGDNVNNLVLLTSDELCELWERLDIVLVGVCKYFSEACDRNKRGKKSQASNLLLARTISSLTLETILHKSFVSCTVLRSVLLLHSTILPNIDHDQTENEISYLMENWWQLDLPWKERAISNAIMYLVRKSKYSSQHVRRLYAVRDAIALLKRTEDVEELLTLAREETVLSLHEGQSLMLHMFTLGDEYILRIHDNMKMALERSNMKLVIVEYAVLYTKIWLSGTERLQQFVKKNCIRDIVYHYFRVNRDTDGKRILSENLFSLLAALHDSESPELRLVVHDACAFSLWQQLNVPGSFIRRNAAEVLFITARVQYAREVTIEKQSYLSRHYETITWLLKDSNSEVCNIAVNGLFETLERFWGFVPHNTIQTWLNVVLDRTKTASNPEIRANIFNGLRKIVTRDNPRALLEDFLPNFALSIYDEDKVVLKAFVKLLWHAHNELEIPFWNIVPMNYIFNRLESTKELFLMRELTKMVWLYISSDDKQDEIGDGIVRAFTKNLNTIRRFCLHCNSVIDYSTCIKLIESLLSLIKREMNRKYGLCTKRTKTDGNEDNNSENESSEDERGDFDFKKIQVYVDIMATLIEANASRKDFYTRNAKTVQKIVEVLPELFTFCEDSPVKESVMVLFSTIPSVYFIDNIDIMAKLTRELCDSNNSDDVLLTLIYVFTKWDKTDIILSALTMLFTTSLRTTKRRDEDADSDKELFQINENGLELGLRMLRHILHAEYKSVLTSKYHNDLVELWKILYIIRTFIERELDDKCNLRSPTSKGIIGQMFDQYVSMISILHKKDVFDATKHLIEILSWVQRTIQPHVLSIDIGDLKDHEICINVLKSIFHAFNLLMIEYKSTPKLCCDVVLLYCRFLPLKTGVAFLKDAFDGTIALLEFSKMAYKNGETSLLTVVVPNFVSITLTALNRCDKDILPTYMENLKVLHELTNKFFSVTDSHSLHISYMSTLLNNAVSNITTAILPVLQYSRITRRRLLYNKLPYLAKRIVKVILSTIKYQKVSVQVMSKTITNYTEIDMLSALMIIYKMLSSTDEQFIEGLKNLTVASRKRIEKQLSDDAAFDRSLSSAYNIVTNAILKH